MDTALLERSAHEVHSRLPDARPVCGLILGSGWDCVADIFPNRHTIDYADIPGLGKPGVPGHHGRLIWSEYCGVDTLIFQGRRHWYEGAGWEPVAVPIFILKSYHAKAVVLTNAAGGINPKLHAGDFMIIEDHINRVTDNPLIGQQHAAWGDRFPAMDEVYCPTLRKTLTEAGTLAGERMGHGVYMATGGPAYETPAEIRAYARVGVDAVGMSTVPEAVLAHAAGIRVAAVSFISNLAAGRGSTPLSHAEVIATARHARGRMTALFNRLWSLMPKALG